MRNHTLARYLSMLAGVLGVLAVSLASAADEQLPPRGEWRATASSTLHRGMTPAMAIDGDPSTKWDGNFAPGQWLQVDMGGAALIGGIIIQWDEAFAPEYTIQYSVDGQHWQIAFQTSDSMGGVDYVLFPSVRARYLRLTSPPNSANGGVSLFEFEPLPAHHGRRRGGNQRRGAVERYCTQRPCGTRTRIWHASAARLPSASAPGKRTGSVLELRAARRTT